MVYWIENCLAAYVSSVQRSLQDENAPVFLIMDNFRSHNITCFQKSQGLEFICMPAYSSHFLHMLDASYFGVMKGQYRRGKTTKQQPKVAGNLICAHRASWVASYLNTVMRSWEATGFQYTDFGTKNPGVRLDLKSILALAEANCQDFYNFVAEASQLE